MAGEFGVPKGTAAGAQLNHLTPRATKSAFADNYLSITGNDFNFTKQFLPEVYEKEVERYGNRTISGFLRMVGAEMPMASDRVVWSEQGRLHIAFDDMTLTTGASNLLTFEDTAGGQTAEQKAELVAVGDTVVLANGFTTIKGYVYGKPAADTITVQPYGAADLTGLGTDADTGIKLFVYGSEYGKGSATAGNSIDASFTTFSNKPIILRNKYKVTGSDAAQIGWVEVTTEAGTSGYLWYLKSEHESRLRFEDHLEMSMVEAELVDGGTAGNLPSGSESGSEGLFSAIESRGLVYSDLEFTSGAATLSDFDEILVELDKQGAIEENMLFLDRATALGIDDMLAAQNSYGADGTSYGVFENSADMAINLGFSGFRRGSYDFYKTDWKYLNDSTTRGLVADVTGVIVPAGVTTVYDQGLGTNIQRPFLHVRYRASEADDRRMKSWITGSVGGNYTSEEDAMNVHFLSERCLCVQAANNFVLLKATTA